jgi:hypothetical protein
LLPALWLAAILTPAGARTLTAVDPPARAPWLAADEKEGRFLLLWRGGYSPRGEEILVTLLDDRSLTFSSPVPLGRGWAAGAAFDPGSGKYLVAVIQSGLVWGHLVNSDGSPGPSFPIAAFRHDGPAPGAQPLVASNGRGLFLVAWTDRDDRGPNGLDVYLQWVSAQGHPVVAARPAGAAPPPAEYLSGRSLLWDPTNGRFVLVWTEGDGQGLVYAFIYPDGRIAPRRRLGIPGTQPNLCLDEKRQTILLSYESLRDRSPHYRMLDLHLRPKGPDRALPGWRKGVDLPGCSFDPRTGTYLITWRNDFDPFFYGQFLSRSGSPLGQPFIAARPAGFTQHSLSLPRPGGGFVFAWEDNWKKGRGFRLRPIHPREKVEPARIRPHPNPPARTK